MTLPNVLASARRRLERLVAAYAAGLPLTVAETLDGACDPLRPRIAVTEGSGATKVLLTRDGHVSEGTGGDSLDLNMYLLDDAEADACFLDTISTVAGLLRQDQAIAASGGNPAAPGPQWFTCHPFLLEAARHWGWTHEDLVRPAEIGGAKGSTIVRNDRSVLTGVLQANQDGADVHFVRTGHRRHLTCGHLSVMAGDGKRIIAQYSDQDGPAVRIPGHRLPDTVLVAIAGLRVRDVVDDARLGAMLDLAITSARNGARGLVLEVADGRIGMGEGEKA